MDSAPSYLQKQEKAFAVPEEKEIAKILGCDRMEANGIWENVKKCKTEIEAQKELEMASILKSTTTPSTVLQVFQLVQSHQNHSTCMTLDN